MVLSSQAQEVARDDVHEAQLSAILIDVEVRHRLVDVGSLKKRGRLLCAGSMAMRSAVRK
jgi:hypothetical protein